MVCQPFHACLCLRALPQLVASQVFAMVDDDSPPAAESKSPAEASASAIAAGESKRAPASAARVRDEFVALGFRWHELRAPLTHESAAEALTVLIRAGIGDREEAWAQYYGKESAKHQS
jgi:hypothetical protein